MSDSLSAASSSTPSMRLPSGEPSPTSPTTLTPSVSAAPPTRFSPMAASPPSSPSSTARRSKKRNRAKKPCSKPDRTPIVSSLTIANMADSLGLVDAVVDAVKGRAYEIYLKVKNLISLRYKKHDATVAACIYIACQQEDQIITMKEICSAAEGAQKKEINKARKIIMKKLEVETGQNMKMGIIHAADYLRDFCSTLGMDNQAVEAAQEAVKCSEELDIRRSPVSIAAAVIYMITQLSENKKPLQDISCATGAAEDTIRKAYKDLYSYASRLIPNTYANEEDLKNLRTPRFVKKE